MAYGNGNVTVQTSVGGPDPNSSGQYAAPPSKKQQQQQQNGGPRQNKPNPLQRYLNNDPTYQNQIEQYQQALADYRAQTQNSREQVGQQFQDTRQAMTRQRSLDLPQIQSDYASRGLLNSGLYGKADADYRTGFQDQLQNLIQSRQSNVTDILQALHQFQNQIGAQKQNARLDAIRRRAAELGVG